MTPEEERLAKRFPLTFAELGTEPAHSPLASYGIECGPGWQPLLVSLFEKLEAEIAKLPEDARPRAAQVKEKAGCLCVYMSLGATQPMRDAIASAQSASTTICEVCSEAGQVRRREASWPATRCEAHVHSPAGRM